MIPEQCIIESAYFLASTLPCNTVETVARIIADVPNESLRSEITHRVPHHHHRELIFTFINRWQTEAKNIDAKCVSTALYTAAFMDQSHRDSQSVELTWTGPIAETISFRRTEQAILQVLDAAEKQITLVSYAVYHIPNIADALIRAARRGVLLTIILETPDKIDGENEYNTIRALGDTVSQLANIYYWPLENRLRGNNGKPGILHVKCVVADAKWLFLSSANLTQQAFTINMELGVLIHGGEMPRRVEDQFKHLVSTSQIVPITP